MHMDKYCLFLINVCGGGAPHDIKNVIWLRIDERLGITDIENTIGYLQERGD